LHLPGGLEESHEKLYSTYPISEKRTGHGTHPECEARMEIDDNENSGGGSDGGSGGTCIEKTLKYAI
jgi:hypothetical protein